MPECASCRLFTIENEEMNCLHVNRPGGMVITRHLLDISSLPPGGIILDIACGLGATLECLRSEYDLMPVGLDLSMQMLKQNREHNPSLKLAQADCSKLPIMSNTLQAVIMECALTLSGEQHKALQEYHRVLDPNGLLLISDIYNREKTTTSAGRILEASRCLSRVDSEENIRNTLINNGFVIRLWEDQTQYLKQWMAQMVFKLGSLRSLYQQFVPDLEQSYDLECAFRDSIKLGYYTAIAEKCG